MQESDQGGNRHLPVPEIGPDLQHHQDQEDDQCLDGLAGDLVSPLTTDLGVRDGVRLGRGGLGDSPLNLGGLLVVECPGLHLDGVRAETDDLGGVHVRDSGGQHRPADVVDGRGRNVGRRTELHTALELDTEVQATHQQAKQRDRDDDDRDRVPEFAALDEAVGNLTRVQGMGETVLMLLVLLLGPPRGDRRGLGVLVVSHVRPPPSR